MLQRSQRTDETTATVRRFTAALNAHDIDAVMAEMSDDCVFENTYPPPDGERYTGQAAVRRFWERMLAASPDARFDTEEMFAAGDRCVVRWRYSYTDAASGQRRRLRGVDLFRVRAGKVAEKLAYVKG